MRQLVSLFALLPLAACAAPAAQPHKQYGLTWSLVMEHAGDEFVLDQGMSPDDCEAAKPINRPDLDQWYRCERTMTEER